MALNVIPHQKLSLKSHPGFSEPWLHDQVAAHTALLGLGELDVIERERPQQGAGRLDFLLTDSEDGIRYEVEIMLGATDPSHIIRCIEYWDIERRRYPAYDHVAVLVAEEITTRFLNVVSLLSGSIPLVAIQLNALQVGDSVVLDFIKVLDQRMLRDDDPPEGEGGDVDRAWWESRKGADKVQLCDRFLELAKATSADDFQLRYKKSHISLSPTGSYFNVVVFWPKQKFVRMRFNVSDAAMWLKKLDDAGIDADSPREDRLRMRLSSAEFSQHESLMRELVKQAIDESK